MFDIKVYFDYLQALWVKCFLDCNDSNWNIFAISRV